MSEPVPGTINLPRKPAAAVAMTVVLPGLGHLYAGEPGTALKRFLLALGGGLVMLALLVVYPLGPLTVPAAVAGVLAIYIWIAIDAARVAQSAPANYTLRSFNRWYVYIGLIIGAWFVSELPRTLVRGTLVEAYRIPSGAMEPTLLIGDFIFVSKREIQSTALRRGAIVVFEAVDEAGIAVIKRIVGLPGDTLSMEENFLLRNGVRVDEPFVIRTHPEHDPQDPRMRLWQLPYFVGEDLAGYEPTLKNWGPLALPIDSIFVLGDNRDNSYDSRYYGLVGTDRVQGFPSHIYYSYDRDGVMPLPFLTAIRWYRMGRRLDR